MKRVYLYMLFIAGMVYACQRFGITLPSIINNYLNDLLCMPLVLVITQMTVKYFKKYNDYKIPFYLILLIVIYYSLYFEWFLPKYNNRYTGDIIDVFLYLIGGILFYIIEKK